MLTSTVSGVTASNTCSGRILPFSGRSATTSNPSSASRAQHSATAGCSTAVVTIRFPRRRSAFTAPKTARLSASVAPEVNTISCGCACSVRAMLSRAFSSVRSAATPSPCRDEGFPKVSRMTAQAASAACGSTFVVALWSRYITKYRAPVYSAKNRSISAWPGSIKTPVAAAFASV